MPATTIADWWHASHSNVRKTLTLLKGPEPGKRHRLRVVVGQIGGRDLLDGELDAGQLGLPPRLQLRNGLEHQVVKALRAAAVERDLRRGERAAQTPAVGVSPPDPLPRAPRGPATAIIHSHRAYLGERLPGQTYRDTIAQSAPGDGVTARRSIPSAVVSDVCEPASRRRHRPPCARS